MIIKVNFIKLDSAPFAVRRVQDPAPVPTCCQFCGSQKVGIVNNATIYGKPYGEWPYMYLCVGCGAYVGIHPMTNIPLGTLADAPLRAARKKAKEPFETWRKQFAKSRGDAYRILAKEMTLTREACHFGMFDMQQCRLAMEVSTRLLNEARYNLKVRK